MKFPFIAIIIVGLIAIAGVAFFLFGDELGLGLSIFDSDKPDGATETFSDTDIYYILVSLKGSTLNYEEAMTHIHALDMKAYGIDGKQYSEVLTEYKVEYASEGYSLATYPIPAPQWTGELCGWTKNNYVITASAGSGNLITTAYGHDTVILMGEGTNTQYRAFLVWIFSS